MFLYIDKQLFRKEKKKKTSCDPQHSLQAQFNRMGALACLSAIPLCWTVYWLGQLSYYASTSTQFLELVLIEITKVEMAFFCLRMW